METMLLDSTTIIFWAKDKLKHMRKLLQGEQFLQHDERLLKYIKGIEKDLTELQKCIEKFCNASEDERAFEVKRRQPTERFIAS